MKPAINARRIMLASLLAGTAAVSTGCSSGGMSLASMNPFAKPASTNLNQSPGITSSIASAASGAGKQVSYVGNSAKSALSKTGNAVAGIFKGSSDAADEVPITDPLSLSNKPEKIGSEVFVANGQLWESTGDFSKAMESYTKALESEPNDAPALTSIARLHFRQGNHKQAADYFQRAITQNATDAGLHNDLGLTLNKLGDTAGASSSLQKALELAPGTSRYANNLASVQFESGNPSAAYQVLASNNKPAVAHFNMAYLYFKGGQVNSAREHLTQVMAFEPQASIDPAIQRAVERSRDMLAQINSASAPIAQAAPHATIAAGQPFTDGHAVQQTSQAGTPRAGVSPVGSYTATVPSLGASRPQASVPATTVSATLGGATQQPTRPMPTQPTSSSQPGIGSEQPSIPFSMPTGFGSY